MLGQGAGGEAGSRPLPGAAPHIPPPPGPALASASLWQPGLRAGEGCWLALPHFLLARRLQAAAGTKGGLCLVLGPLPGWAAALAGPRGQCSRLQLRLRQPACVGPQAEGRGSWLSGLAASQPGLPRAPWPPPGCVHPPEQEEGPLSSV